MSGAQHTPGPWVANKQYVVGPRDDSETQMHGFVVGVADVYGDNRDADARLIAAAPDLLAELQMQVRNCPMCKGTGKAVSFEAVIYTAPPHDETDCGRCASSRAAIAKAEGQT